MVHGGNGPQGICEGKKTMCEQPDAAIPQPVLLGFFLLQSSGIYGGRCGLLMALSDALSSRHLYL